MHRLPWLVAGLLTIVVGSSVCAQDSSPVLIYVTVPADAKLAVDGTPVSQTGPQRRLITPPFRIGETGKYTLTATFSKDGKTVSVERAITVVGGQVTRVDLTKDSPKAAEPKKTDPGPAPQIEAPKKEHPRVEPKTEPKKHVHLDVPYVPTPKKVVDEMLKLANVKANDVVYDLGCGDGRIVISAVKDFKARRGVGVDIDPERVKESKQNAEKAGVTDKVEIREGDVLKIKDLSDASVVMLYLLPDVNEKLRPMLRKTLKAGARVVSHDFDMGEEWRPDKEVTVKDDTGRIHTLFLWTIKEKPAPLDDTPPLLKKDNKPAPKKDNARPAEKKEDKTIRVPYVPTPQPVVEEMLKLANVKEGDVVYDLGCGDGRIVITAVQKYKAKKGVGIDPERIKDSKKNAKEAKVEDKVEFRQGDVLKIDSVADANVVTLYLFPEVNERLQPMLKSTLKSGSRVVSHDFLMKPDWKPDKEVTVKDTDGQEHTLYLWTIK